MRVAELRTKGLVRLHQGQFAAAERLLRDALTGVEPYWLRALTLGCLGIACVQLGRPEESMQLANAARRLHPQGRLLDAVREAFERRGTGQPQLSVTAGAPSAPSG